MKKVFIILIIMAMGMLIGQVDYGSQIQTVIDANCTNSGCHTNGGAYQNGLDLSSYDNLMTGDSENGPVVIPLDHANSLLWQKVNSGAMPPGNNPDLSGDEVNLIASWIDEGALETLETTVVDLDNNGTQNILDLNILIKLIVSNGFQEYECLLESADVNYDGQLTIIDVILLAQTLLND